MNVHSTATHAASFLLELGPYDEEDLKVLRFECRESISEPFNLQIELVSRDSNLDFAQIIGQSARLTMRGPRGDRFLHGVAADFQQTRHTPEHTFYEVRVVPRLWLLQQRANCRIFQEQTIDQTITEVLEAAGLVQGIDFRFELNGTHPEHIYCVQYRETDLAFISRLLEEEGVSYFFEHDASGCVMVMSDQGDDYPDIDGDQQIRHAPTDGMVGSDEQIFDLAVAQSVRSGRCSLTDFRFQEPEMRMKKSASAGTGAELEVYDYPGRYDTPETGAFLARVRLEEQQAFRKHASGKSNCLRLAAGYCFELTEHARQEFNQPYLVTEVVHRGSHPQSLEAEVPVGGEQEALYVNHFTAIPASVPYRPPRRIPRPIVRGAQTAVVVGPPGQEIHTDEYGRVKVQFHWDRQGRRDEHSSCWIRVSQPWAGTGWGGLAIPRIDQEVIIDFLEGDPDRPILTGRVYNGDVMPPQSLPGEKARMTIRSNSLGGSGGSNEITMDDTGGSENFFVHAQYDMNEVTENNRTTRVGNDDTEMIEGAQAVTVVRDREKTVQQNETSTIGVDRTEEVGANEAVTIGASRNHGIGTDDALKVGGNLSVDVGSSRTAKIGATCNELVVGAKTITVGGALALTAGGAMNTAVGGAQTEEVGLVKKIIVGKSFELVCGAGKIKVESDGKITIEGTQILLSASGPVKINGAVVDLN